MKKYILIILLILIIALSLRLTGVNRSLIHDEALFAMSAKNFAFFGEPITLINPAYDGGYEGIMYFDPHPPMGLLLYTLSVKIFDLSTFAYRIVPIFFGILTIIGTYYLGREMFSRRIGLIAAALMAVSRYHILASQTVDLDGGIMVFFNVMTVLFIVRYMNNKENTNLILSGSFLALSLFTKLNGFLVIIPILAYIYLKEKKLTALKKPVLVFILFTLIFVGTLYLYSVSMDYPRGFTEPFRHMIAHPHIGEQAISEVVLDKIFYIAIVTWQLTPFLSILILLALFRNKRDPKFYMIAIWILIAFLIYAIPFNGDKQRYIAGILPPIFILVACYIDKNIIWDSFTKKAIPIIAASTIILSYMFAVNDLMGYYNYLALGIIYLLAFLLLIPNRKTIFLLSAFIGLSLYSILSFSTWPYMQSYTIESLNDKIDEYNIPKENVWSNKDILFYMFPEETYLNIKYPEELNPEYVKNNNIEYIAYHSMEKRKSEEMILFSQYCIRQYTVDFYGNIIGLLCEIDKNKV